MEILEPDEFFRRVGPPGTWKPLVCGGVVTGDETDEELRGRGLSGEAIVEVRDYVTWLKLPKPRHMDFPRFRRARRREGTTECSGCGAVMGTQTEWPAHQCPKDPNAGGEE